MVAIATILFAMGLLIVRINLRSLLIFYVIGLCAVTLWMVVDSRFLVPQRKRARSEKIQPCICPVCNHENQAICFEHKCACCLIMKKDKVVGHSSSPLQ
jgi:hypothetical protein